MDIRVPVILCGRAQRGDDAAALRAVGLLPRPTRRRAEFIMASKLDLLLLLDLPDHRPCLVVDAVAGVPAGTLVTSPLTCLAEAAHGRLPGMVPPTARSSRKLPLEQVLALAGLLRDAPLGGTFLGLGGAHFKRGLGLSAPVKAALPAFATALGMEIQRLSTT